MRDFVQQPRLSNSRDDTRRKHKTEFVQEASFKKAAAYVTAAFEQQSPNTEVLTEPVTASSCGHRPRRGHPVVRRWSRIRLRA